MSRKAFYSLSVVDRGIDEGAQITMRIKYFHFSILDNIKIHFLNYDIFRELIDSNIEY